MDYFQVESKEKSALIILDNVLIVFHNQAFFSYKISLKKYCQKIILKCYLAFLENYVVLFA